jgi:hypothetical protein
VLQAAGHSHWELCAGYDQPGIGLYVDDCIRDWARKGRAALHGSAA